MRRPKRAVAASGTTLPPHLKRANQAPPGGAGAARLNTHPRRLQGPPKTAAQPTSPPNGIKTANPRGLRRTPGGAGHPRHMRIFFVTKNNKANSSQMTTGCHQQTAPPGHIKPQSHPTQPHRKLEPSTVERSQRQASLNSCQNHRDIIGPARPPVGQINQLLGRFSYSLARFKTLSISRSAMTSVKPSVQSRT